MLPHGASHLAYPCATRFRQLLRISGIELVDLHYGDLRGVPREILRYPIQGYGSAQEEFGLKLGLTGLAYYGNSNHEGGGMTGAVGRWAKLDG